MEHGVFGRATNDTSHGAGSKTEDLLLVCILIGVVLTLLLVAIILTKFLVCGKKRRPLNKLDPMTLDDDSPLATTNTSKYGVVKNQPNYAYLPTRKEEDDQGKLNNGPSKRVCASETSIRGVQMQRSATNTLQPPLFRTRSSTNRGERQSSKTDLGHGSDNKSAITPAKSYSTMSALTPSASLMTHRPMADAAGSQKAANANKGQDTVPNKAAMLTSHGVQALPSDLKSNQDDVSYKPSAMSFMSHMSEMSPMTPTRLTTMSRMSAFTMTPESAESVAEKSASLPRDNEPANQTAIDDGATPMPIEQDLVTRPNIEDENLSPDLTNDSNSKSVTTPSNDSKEMSVSGAPAVGRDHLPLMLSRCDISGLESVHVTTQSSDADTQNATMVDSL